jgi:hypothetical protein
VWALVFGFFLWFCCLVVAIYRVSRLGLIGFCLWVFKLGCLCILSSIPKGALRFFFLYIKFYLSKKKKKKNAPLPSSYGCCELHKEASLRFLMGWAR